MRKGSERRLCDRMSKKPSARCELIDCLTLFSMRQEQLSSMEMEMSLKMKMTQPADEFGDSGVRQRRTGNVPR
jgi:hypothetical protein